MLTIREAEEKDIPDICRIVAQLSPGFEHNYTNAIGKFRSHIKRNPDYYLWVADRDGAVVGTAMMHLQHKLSYLCGTAAHLEDVVVDKSDRGNGVGKLLVQKAIQTAIDHECYKIMLTCLEKTVPYYEPFGFKVHDIGMRLDLQGIISKRPAGLRAGAEYEVEYRAKLKAIRDPADGMYTIEIPEQTKEEYLEHYFDPIKPLSVKRNDS